MTTAAPPEKMTLDALRAEGWAVAVHNDYRMNGEAHTFWLFTKGDHCVKGEGRTDAEALIICREAARRLSAPAGDGEVLTAVHCGTATGKSQLMRASGAIAGVIFDDHKLAVAICNALSAPAPAAPRVGDGPPREPTGKMWSDGRRAFLSQAEKHHQANTSKVADAYADVSPAIIWREMWDAWAALSAPPAASAEREMCRACNGQGTVGVWVAPLVHSEGRCRACNGTGYRKLAPAQSVGQSVAKP